MSLLSGTLQPPLLVFLDSTSEPPLSPLWRAHTDGGDRSFVEVLRDVEYPRVAGAAGSPACGDGRDSGAHHIPKHAQRGSVPDPVIHIQSPGVAGAYIQAGGHVARAGGAERPLGVELSWIGIQLKPLGARALSVEVGVLDASGREGAVRLSSWKKEPALHADRAPPLIHLPLALPDGGDGAPRATDWAELTVHLPPLLALFRALQKLQAPRAEARDADLSTDKRARVQAPAADLPEARFGSVSYVRIYANCRVRRVWFAADGERTLAGSGVRAEWALRLAE